MVNMEKIVVYLIKYNEDSTYQLPVGMTLKEAKQFAKNNFPYDKITLVARVYEQTMEVNLD